MKILHVNKFLYRRGGAESYMLDLVDAQRQAGHEVATFGMAHPDNDPQIFEHTFPSYVEFDPMPRAWTTRVASFGRMLYSTSARHGMHEVIDRFRPDVVHLHNVYHQLSPSVLAPPARAGVPMVMTLHDFKLACPTYGFLRDGAVCEACVPRRFDRAVRLRCHEGSLTASAAVALELSLHTLLGAYRPIQLFLCPSQFMFQKMTEARVFPDRLRRVDNFVDTAHLHPKTGPGQGALFVGRLALEKGVDVLIRAAPLLPPGEIVDIVGEGPEQAALEALAEQTAPGRIRFHGRLGSAAVVDMMTKARVVVVPTLRYENQPMVILEAFAVGTPIITTNHGGGPELATDPRVATLVPPGDVPALAAAITAHLDADRARAAIDPCRARALQFHSAEGHLERIESLYHEAEGLLRGDRLGASDQC